MRVALVPFSCQGKVMVWIRNLLVRWTVLATVGLVAVGCATTTASPSFAAEATPVSSPVASPQASSAGTPVPATTDAAAYCVKMGGIVRLRTPTLGTNNPPADRLVLGGARGFCEFTGGAGADDGSWIAIDLDSLASPEPTMAVLAYLTKPTLPKDTGGANPASIYCAHLGGAELGATSLNGGGWVTTDTDTPIDVLEACAFADGSIIDSWGITYHAGGTIRGADLTGKFAYQSANPPHVFPES